MKTRVIIHGVAGRMGRAILDVAAGMSGVQVSGGIESPLAVAQIKDIKQIDSRHAGPVLTLDEFGHKGLEADVLIDFSNAAAVAPLCKALDGKNIRLVSGTTGLEAADCAALERLASSVGVVSAPNMSLGVNLLFSILPQIRAKLGADYDVEVIEIHHRHKVDAPSGTAKGLIAAVNEGASSPLTPRHGREGITGERRPDEIGVHALRAGDIVGDHTVLFAGPGERIEVTHRAHGRDGFASGALKAAQWVAGQRPGLYSMNDVLGLGR